MLMSPYPGLDKPISLQAWGYQLKVDNADDSRIDEFIKALRQNATQEPQAGCSSGITTPDRSPAPGAHRSPRRHSAGKSDGADAAPGANDDVHRPGATSTAAPARLRLGACSPPSWSSACSSGIGRGPIPRLTAPATTRSTPASLAT